MRPEPRPESSQAPGRRPAPEGAQPSSAPRAGPVSRTVLLLEDDNPVAGLIKAALGMHDFRVTRVTNGAEGLKCVLASDYGVILCDMVMPGFPGDMFYRAVERVRPHLCHRFIFMTGHTGDPRINEFVRSIHGVLIWKPFEIHSLLETVNTVLKAQVISTAAPGSVLSSR